MRYERGLPCPLQPLKHHSKPTQHHPASCLTAARHQGLTAPGSSPCCFRAVLSLTISRWYATLAVAMYFCSSTRTTVIHLRRTGRATIGGVQLLHDTATACQRTRHLVGVADESVSHLQVCQLLLCHDCPRLPRLDLPLQVQLCACRKLLDLQRDAQATQL